jgi:hypothetical protein
MSRKRPEPPRSDPSSPAITGKRPQDWSALERAQVVVEAAGLSEEELGEFLRRRGLHREQLQEWPAVLQESLAGGNTGGRRSAESKRIRQLERELVRKDKALAETTALLVLKTKADVLLGGLVDEDDDTGGRNEN